jgi:hypothetical protein
VPLLAWSTHTQDVIRDELYWQAYERAKLAAREAQRRAAKAREDAADALAGDGGEGDWQVRRTGGLGCVLAATRRAARG